MGRLLHDLGEDRGRISAFLRPGVRPCEAFFAASTHVTRVLRKAKLTSRTQLIAGFWLLPPDPVLPPDPIRVQILHPEQVNLVDATGTPSTLCPTANPVPVDTNQ